MLDDHTMRIALSAVSLTVLVLFYLGVYRPTGSSFSAWWTLSLLTAGASNALLMLNGTDLQWVTSAASIVLAAAASTCVWFATRTLRRERLPIWVLGAGPLVIVVPTLLNLPADSVWSGNGPLYFYMAVVFVAASVEMWRAWAARRAMAEHELNREAVVALLVIAMAGTTMASFYVLRSVIYLVVGSESGAFELTHGSSTEVALLMICIVAVTFSVSAIGWDERTKELRSRAMRDDLTGLLGRTEFRLQTESAFAAARSSEATVLLAVADLDHFKGVNDVHGHAAGDGALVAFASTLGESLKAGELAGRLGGEEFGMVLLNVDDAGAMERLRALSETFAAQSSIFHFPLPTVSYGIAGPGDGDTVAQVFERADVALYRAKADGRDRAVRYSAGLGRRSGRVGGRRESDGDPNVHADRRTRPD